MIVITRCLAKRLKTVLRQALNLTSRRNLPIIQFMGGSHGLRVRCGNGEAAVEFLLEGEQPEETIYIPFELLADIEGGRQTPVEISCQKDKITASWRDRNVPQFVHHDVPVVKSENWPPMPDQMVENSPELLPALRDASQTIAPESARYALSFLQLDGDRGEIIGTDGRQVLLQSGYSFPWDEKILVPGSKLFGSKQLPSDLPVLIGRVEKWFLFRVGPWTFWIWINADGRFPEVTSQIGQPKWAIASCALGATDRKFLLDNLSRLPCDDQNHFPVTMDLNGSIALRGKQHEPPSCTELLLSASTRSGEPIRFNTNRQYLQRAVQLGFDQLYLFGNESPALASDGRRSYVWALLESKSAIAPDPNATRIESATTTQTTKIPKSDPRRHNPMTTSVSSTNGSHKQIGKTEQTGKSIDELIEKGEKLKTNLRETLSSTSELIAGLKSQKKRTKQMRSTLLSLKQLQAIDG